MNIERSEKVLSLQLEWVRTADAKVPPVFAINLVMLGVIVALMKALTSWDIATAIFTALCLILLVLSIASLAFAMFPRMSGPKGSNIFFGGITKKEEASYLEEVKNMSDDNYENDLLSQIYRNAEIAEKKYYYVKLAFVSSFISVPFWLIAIYLLYL